MERVPVVSSALRSVGYDEGTLEIRFVNRSVYRYFDVPERVHARLMEASSHGEFFNAHIRERFRYERV
ncbi:MAG: KTSC domain-containing protein [Actinomycetota bacterium]|nr:KTSC domain-containing protein [Actinomycetota bacterium]